MKVHLQRGASAIALAALVLIWNEAPIADSPVAHRLAATDQPSAEQVERRVPNVNSGPVIDQRSDAVVRGGRSVGPAAEPAKPAMAPAKHKKAARTGMGPAGTPNVAH
jgi:hypothetical protein